MSRWCGNLGQWRKTNSNRKFLCAVQVKTDVATTRSDVRRKVRLVFLAKWDNSIIINDLHLASTAVSGTVIYLQIDPRVDYYCVGCVSIKVGGWDNNEWGSNCDAGSSYSSNRQIPVAMSVLRAPISLYRYLWCEFSTKYPSYTCIWHHTSARIVRIIRTSTDTVQPRVACHFIVTSERLPQ